MIVGGALDRPRRCSTATGSTVSRSASATCCTARRSRPPQLPEPARATRLPAPTPAAEVLELGRRLVLGQPPLQDAAREHTDERSPPSTTGTRSASHSSSRPNASSSGSSGSIVQFGASASSPTGVERGSRPAATTRSTSVLRVTTPTKPLARRRRRPRARRAARGARPPPAPSPTPRARRGSAIIASRTPAHG